MEGLGEQIGVTSVCEVLSLPRSTLLTPRKPRPARVRQLRLPPQALSAEEKARVRQTLNGERFADQAPPQADFMIGGVQRRRSARGRLAHMPNSPGPMSS